MFVFRSILLLLTLLAGTVAAESNPPNLGVYSALRLASDYRFNGASNSDGKPALQGYVHVTHSSGWYSGAWASSVDFNDPEKTRGELDLYAGRSFLRDAMEYRAEAMHLSFDEHVPGPTYDFWQGKVVARRYINTSWIEASLTHTPRGPYAGGAQSQVRLEAQYGFSQTLRATGLLGYGLNRERPDRFYGAIGLELDWRKLTFGAQWLGTDQSRDECFGENWCEPGFVGSVTLWSW